MKTPVLAMLLAGATAQRKRPEMAQDHAAPLDPVKPGDLEGCSDDDVAAAKSAHVAAVQALEGLNKALAPLQGAVTEKLKAKQEAIQAVIAKDELDAGTIKADYDAAAAEIAARLAYQGKVEAYNAAKRAYDTYVGEVQVASGVADDPGTADTDESKKQVGLIKAAGGEPKAAADALQAAKDEQAKLATALSDANDNYTHWDTVLKAEEAKVGGLEGTVGTTKTDSDNADTAVSDLDALAVSKNADWVTKKALYDTAKAQYDALDGVKKANEALEASNKAGAKVADASTFSTEAGQFKTQAIALKGKHADFITSFNLHQASDQWTALTGGKLCGTSTPYGAPDAATTLAACKTNCLAKKYLLYTTWVAGKTDYTSEWTDWFNNAAKDGLNAMLSTGQSTGCLGFQFTGTTGVADTNGACLLQDTAAPAIAGDNAKATCYIRKAVTTSAATQAEWKEYFLLSVGDYKTKKEAFEAKFTDPNWATYETNGLGERARLAALAVLEKETAKATAQLTAFKQQKVDGTGKMPYDAGYSDTDAASTVKAVMDSTKGDMDTAKGLKDTADGNVANLAYFNKVEAKKTENAKYAAAKAALEAVKPTKIDRVKAIMNHMNENGAGLKGTIKDITDAKAAIDSKINTATTGLQAVNDAAAKKKGDLADAVTKAKGEMGVEKGKWDEAKGKAEKALSDADPNLKAVNALREKVKQAGEALGVAEKAMKEQVEKISGKEGVDKGQDGKVAGLLAAWEVAVDKCKGLKYDQYRIDVAEKKAARESTLTAIERLLDARKTIAHGATNGRCEKPQSNGDHLRRGKCAAESDCCGAATGRPHGATGPLVTIEVCQEKASKTWGYVAPRAPLATAEPAADPWPFKCIDGASKLAGAAAAVLTSAYMMA